MPDDKRRPPYISERNPPFRVFDVFEGEVLHLYADGSARLRLGPEVSKIEFVRSLGAKTKDGAEVDQREMFLRLSLPTSALIELCAIALEQYGLNSQALQAGNASNINILREALKRAAAVKI
jgi:hypothetical protein